MVIRSYIEHRGMYPQVAMLHYLEIAEGLETYGVDFFQICNRRGTSLLLGIDSMGLAIYKPQNKISPKVGFPWSEIRNISFNDRKFTIKPIDKSSKVSQIQTHWFLTIYTLGYHNGYETLINKENRGKVPFRWVFSYCVKSLKSYFIGMML
uniref:FERM domain-containing protein n=1 Tax=Mesocestoides corti TaxID=53468 RepID=A0A5K3FC57_MESCO